MHTGRTGQEEGVHTGRTGAGVGVQTGGTGAGVGVHTGGHRCSRWMCTQIGQVQEAGVHTGRTGAGITDSSAPAWCRLLAEGMGPARPPGL